MSPYLEMVLQTRFQLYQGHGLLALKWRESVARGVLSGDSSALRDGPIHSDHSEQKTEES